MLRLDQTIITVLSDNYGMHMSIIFKEFSARQQAVRINQTQLQTSNMYQMKILLEHFNAEVGVKMSSIRQLRKTLFITDKKSHVFNKRLSIWKHKRLGDRISKQLKEKCQKGDGLPSPIQVMK